MATVKHPNGATFTVSDDTDLERYTAYGFTVEGGKKAPAKKAAADKSGS